MEDRFASLADEIGRIPYVRALGAAVDDLEPGRARIRLPFREDNANPGNALHGGVAASMIDLAGATAAWTEIEDGANLEASVVDLTVNYLAAAIGEEIVATGEVLRRGKELTYVTVEITTTGGKPIARGLVTHRAAPRREEPRAFGDPPDASAQPPGEVSSFGKMFMMVPFIHRLGMRNERMENGTSRLRLPFSEAIGDTSGAIHEGALLAFADTTGAVASWSITGPDPSYKASTVSVHASFLAPAIREDAIALGRTIRRHEELFWNEVTVLGAETGRRIAHANVLYRIVVP